MRRFEEYAVLDPEILAEKDMTDIYMTTGFLGVAYNQICPTILWSDFIDEEGEIGCINDGKGHYVIALNFLRDPQKLIWTLRDWFASGGCKGVELAEYEEKGNDMSNLYLYIASIAEMLGVRCPLVIDRDVVDEDNPECMLASAKNEFTQKTAYMVLRSDWAEDILPVFYGLAKEMRHVWQEEKEYEKFFGDQKLAKASPLHPANVDAEAFAYRLTVDLFYWDPLAEPFGCREPEYVDAVKKAVEEMHFEYSVLLRWLGDATVV